MHDRNASSLKKSKKKQQHKEAHCSTLRNHTKFPYLRILLTISLLYVYFPTSSLCGKCQNLSIYRKSTSIQHFVLRVYPKWENTVMWDIKQSQNAVLKIADVHGRVLQPFILYYRISLKKVKFWCNPLGITSKVRENSLSIVRLR